MEKNEIFNYENIKLCEAPPVAFINMEKKNYKIIYLNNLSILKNSKCNKEPSKLKIDIESDVLKVQDKKVLIDIINFIQRFCDLSLISTIFDLNGTDLNIKKDEKDINKYSLVLKDKKDKNIYINQNNNELSDFYCPNHNKHFKDRQSLQNHNKAKHKFKCHKCGQLFGKKAKLENHLFYNCHSIKNNNNNINQKEESVINVFYNDINHPYNNIINENNALKKEDKMDIIKDKQFKKEKEYKKQGLFKRNENKKKIEESKRKQEEIIKKEELKRKQDELKKKNELKTFKNKKNSKTNEDYYVCYIDGKEFIKEKDYVNHFSLNHKNDYPFYCEICRKGFFSFQAIDNHNFSKNH